MPEKVRHSTDMIVPQARSVTIAHALFPLTSKVPECTFGVTAVGRGQLVPREVCVT